ncbi:MAG: siroheme synthase CysG [Hyphomonadaceae bacterium]
MHSFPAFFPLEGRRVVVIGAGEAADAKARLFEGGPAELLRLAAPDAAALAGAALVFVAEADPAKRMAAVRAARAARAPLNVVDHPGLCDFYTPAIVDRGALVIAVSSSGAAPTLARDLRAKIEALVPAAFERLAAFAERIRPRVSARRPGLDGRRRAWEAILRGAAGEHALAGDFDAAERAAEKALQGDARAAGVVHLIGAGPGDPELLTLKALRVLQDADVIYYDKLVDPRILELARRDAARVFVGKARGAHAMAQREIEARIIAAAKAGQRVARLKGGDPFIFGRGGEELDALRQAGVAAFVVPGVTAALGCAAEAGVPLTHRDHAQAVTFVTGHSKAGAAPDIDWAALSSPRHTIVVYMGVDAAPIIARKLIEAGRAPQTPALVIENGTTPRMKRAAGKLERLGELIIEAEIYGPAILIIGDVAQAAAADADSRATLEHAP